MIWIPGVDFRHHEFISLCQAVPICSGNVGKLKCRVNYSPFLDCLGFFFYFIDFISKVQIFGRFWWYFPSVATII